ncbi:MAG: sigma-70 family RNA polymerase sigma factor [Lachnospiraceae bacterium]|nr:sigma-70 family RNA polymerase sigma factor [Lachnospiraceae bacterium]
MLSLVKKAISGDTDAFLELMDINQPSMLRIAHGFFSQEEDIADAMQDTILDAFEHLSSLKEPRYFKTWLMRILINNCSHIYSKNKKYVSLEKITPDAEAHTQAPDTPLYRFYELLSYISEENRLCFQLYYGEGFGTREIADILHMKESTVRSRMHREKIKLKSKLLKDGYIPLYGKEGTQS